MFRRASIRQPASSRSAARQFSFNGNGTGLRFNEIEVGYLMSDYDIYQIFFPTAFHKTVKAINEGTRFVHYTSAGAMVGMLRATKGIWLRNAALMNDFSEIEHGRTCLTYAWDHSEIGKRFKGIVEEIAPGTIAQLENTLNHWLPSFSSKTYLASLSEHDVSEDTLGRLSMWRAYGGETGIAIVLNGGVFLRPSDAIHAYTSPVAYLHEEEFAERLGEIADNMHQNAPMLRELGADGIYAYLFDTFRFALLCTKHPGFKEEREWRIVYSPELASSDRIKKSVELVRGVPQFVHTIPFKDYPNEGFYGAELPQLVDRVIVGPTEFPLQVREAIVSLLEEAGIEDAAQKVFCSTIPLRV
ncbi:DUF2971 domain-containing protein [Notoacmeibacter ruber]|uniref:DUF2971 domain-containing protein n=1 Tax=Notoacmeibacter ruber TaxID=2670375 RepID=UPI001AECC0F0|nr:DUF2971 domain-containing protein [Notoacmeibacter ruber]